jgi:hypothetical protein
MSSLTLTVALEVDPTPSERTADDLINRVQLLAPHVDAIRVNTTGIGFAIADRLRRAGVAFEPFNPAERRI